MLTDSLSTSNASTNVPVDVISVFVILFCAVFILIILASFHLKPQRSFKTQITGKKNGRKRVASRRRP